MNKSQDNFWFPAKRYGWGWGAPVQWQGWVALVVYVGLLVVGGAYFRLHKNVAGFLLYAAIATVALVIVMAYKGEKPLAWRWGQ